MAVLMAVWLPYDVTLTFPKERRIFLRERKAGLYTTSQFYLARITADAPAHTVSALIMALIIWGMAGLQLGMLCVMILSLSPSCLCCVSVYTRDSLSSRRAD